MARKKSGKVTNGSNQPSTIETKEEITTKLSPIVAITVAIITTLGTIIAAYIGIIPEISKPQLPTVTPTIQTTDISIETVEEQLPTPIFLGKPILSINFSKELEGKLCGGNIGEETKWWGYDESFGKFYIIPNTNGYIAICHSQKLIKPQGSLEVTTDYRGDNDHFGFGVLFGWDGKNRDFCGFIVRKEGKSSRAGFKNIVNGQDTNSNFWDIEPVSSGSHNLRFVIDSNGKGVGYLDNQYLGEHTFENCDTGPIGLIAYGTGTEKIFFDNLSLNEIP